MSEKNIKPQIRFKGFTEDWEVRKLNEIADVIGGGTPSTSVLEYWDGDIDWYSPTEIGKEIYAIGSVKKITLLGLEKSSARMLPPNKTVLFTSRAGIGYMAILKRDGATNQGFQSLVVKDGINPYFIYSIGHLIKEYALKHASGSTFLEISGKVLGNMDINIPLTSEQSKIGTYFNNLDQLITLNQHKYNKLVTIKKAMLEKMFPKEGTDVPEIRFKGFTEAWVEKELGEMATIKTGYPIDSNNFNDNGEYLVITNGNIQNDSHIVDNSYGNRINIENNASLSEHILNPNDILVTMDGTVGRTAKVEEQKQILAQRVGRLTAKLESEFLYQFLNTGKFFKEMSLISHGGTIKHISLTEISGFISYMPSYREEQKKIGAFFKHFDTLITLQKRELEKLKNIKKACLERMFV